MRSLTFPKTLIIVISSFWLSGCATSLESGVYLAAGPPSETYSENAKKPRIAIGTASAYRLVNERRNEKQYEDYQRAVARIYSDRNTILSREQFAEAIAGWTRLKLFTVPMVMGIYVYTLVPAGMDAEIKFASAAGTILAQETGDLLMARSNADGIYVVEAVLCQDDGAGYFDCAAAYEKGIFDALTGMELDEKELTQKNDGKRISLESFKRIDGPSEDLSLSFVTAK